ncbi:ribose 5-phosphate isomerase B [Parabacteroides sp. 52]|uniref:ribose 5-phosphate isomerase B n=1 Tax=unclassified Parabacteroides TaxID=2649774 RepID=UPI0013D22B4C|nr:MULTISPECIES: ribose 5-phosphate isomerase B [unclassified Parabacteroides]MDH6533734.1 ribose 5-phosphate isomerase B [Parabacteroides sp. PM5-20]NDV54486.1 ribose 5-phosphate isomerase B [Parabacteroides sp. 52]
MHMIGLCSDHAGFKTKEFIKQLLDQKGLPYKDFGTYSEESCDYPDFAHLLGYALERGEVYPGIAVCGSGVGINIALNKHQGVRAALCWMPEIARLSRAHNDANVLVIPGRFTNNKETTEIVEAFFNTAFEGGRHQKRVDKIPL